MPVQAFLLDSNATGYAAFLAALATYDAAHYDFTPTQTLRDASHDSTLKIVFADVTEAEINADSDLTAARQNSYGEFEGTELCRHRWYSLADFRIRGFHMLGESVRSTIGVAGQDYWVIRQKTRQASGSGLGPGYGEKTGKTMYDAADGCQDTSIFTSGTWPEGGALMDFCGPLHKSRVEQASGADGTDINGFMSFVAGDYSADPLTIRMDNPQMAGCVVGTIQDHDWLGGDKGNAWTQDGTNPNVWSRPTSNISTSSQVLYIDPTWSSEDILQQGYLEEVADLATCRSTDWSFWPDTGTGTLHVNIANGRDPRHRIASSGDSSGLWDVAAAITDSDTRSSGINFIHCTFINCGNVGGGKTGNNQWRGCRFLAGTAFRPIGLGTAPNLYLGWSEDGVVPFDTSDLPDPSTDEYILKAIAKGSNGATWDTMSRWCQFYGTSAGFYQSGTGFFTADADGGTLQGIYSRYVGESPTWAAVRNLPSVMFDNIDGHTIGMQGISGFSASFVYIKREDYNQSGNPIELYPNADTTNCQNNVNFTLTDFVVIGGSIGFSGHGVYARRNGTGLLTGTVLRRGCIAENPIDGDNDVYNGVPNGSYGVFSTWNERIEIDSVHFLRVGNCMGGEAFANSFSIADMCENGSESTSPLHGYLIGNNFWYHDCTFEDWGGDGYEGRIFENREGGQHRSFDTIVSITKGSPCRVEVTGHGYPDFTTPATGIYGHPEVYFANMSGMTELDGNVYFAVWVDANHFDLYSSVDSNGDPATAVDSTSFGTFVSGNVARACCGGLRGEDNVFIKSGVTATNVDMYKYANTGYTLEEFSDTVGPGLPQQLPGCSDATWESGYSLNP